MVGSVEECVDGEAFSVGLSTTTELGCDIEGVVGMDLGKKGRNIKGRRRKIYQIGYKSASKHDHGDIINEQATLYSSP